MCDALTLPLSEFTPHQVQQHLLNDFFSGGLVTLHCKAKPALIPFLYCGNTELTNWPGTYPAELIESSGLNLKPVLILRLQRVSPASGFASTP